MQRGHQVIGVVTAVTRQVPAGVEPLVADLFDPAALNGVLGEVDGAVHAASSNDERAGALDRTVVNSLLDAFEGTGKPLVYTSGLWLHGNTGDQPATEDRPFAPPTVVSWRPAVEDLLVEAAASRAARTVRIRPALVYGHGRGYVPMLLNPQDGDQGPVVRHIGDGTNRWATVHADDLGDLYALAVESAPSGSVYLAADDRSHQVRDIAQAVADLHGVPVESWDPLDAEKYWSVMVEAFLLDQVASSEKAHRELGWRCQRPTLFDDLRTWRL
ncbi:hypothetical protein AOZ06_29060 [Kibdelosporangium phytohabitans]|uniref:NAD-dependent epimerase/dehydratase domain-containing protein n=1 Tax=Kibdelosporangium phytohabitans TaxID=860235 RepID=A0A0N9I3D2_9PSEU|nr:hypothetical protein AOZ06_29060 [Kibdelosporangium phytohabitans]